MNKSDIIASIKLGSRAEEAAQFYASLFPESDIKAQDSGGISARLWGTSFQFLKELPKSSEGLSISFFVYCGSDAEIERIYAGLIADGNIIMPLAQYPWTQKYAWVEDRYGVHWQLDVDDIRVAQKIVSCLHFSGKNTFRVRAALHHYVNVFPDARILMEVPFADGSGLPADAIMFAQCRLQGIVFNLMSSRENGAPPFTDNVFFCVCVETDVHLKQILEKLLPGHDGAFPIQDTYHIPWRIKVCREDCCQD
jgi:predicted 3-demethylubiquinone-9 3-methyltransferase (glyoxalase superfamily)